MQLDGIPSLLRRPGLRYAPCRHRRRCQRAARPSDVAEPEGPGTVFACWRAGCAGRTSRSSARVTGSVLGHEVVAETRRRQPRRAGPPRALRRVRALPRRARVDVRAFWAATIRPGGFAERVRADGWVELPADSPTARGTMVEPLACVLRGAERMPRGRVLIVGNGFVGRLFGRCSSCAATRCSRSTRIPAGPGGGRTGPSPPPSSRGAAAGRRVEAVEPGGTVLVFADAGAIPAGRCTGRS